MRHIYHLLPKCKKQAIIFSPVWVCSCLQTFLEELIIQNTQIGIIKAGFLILAKYLL